MGFLMSMWGKKSSQLTSASDCWLKKRGPDLSVVGRGGAKCWQRWSLSKSKLEVRYSIFWQSKQEVLEVKENPVVLGYLASGSCRWAWPQN